MVALDTASEARSTLRSRASALEKARNGTVRLTPDTLFGLMAGAVSYSRFQSPTPENASHTGQNACVVSLSEERAVTLHDDDVGLCCAEGTCAATPVRR